MIDFYDKIGNYTLDVSKYVLTGVVITTFFKSFDENESGYIYPTGLIVALSFMIMSFWAYRKHNELEKKKDAKTKKGGKK